MPAPVPYLWFTSEAEEAAPFSVDVFPNSEITSMVRYPSDDVPGPSRTGDVLEVSFTLDGAPHVALNGFADFPFGEAVSLQVPCADQAEADRCWERLVEGGGEHGACGWLKDHHGLSWQVYPRRLMELLGDDRDRAARAFRAMLQMSRIDVAEIERAADDRTEEPR